MESRWQPGTREDVGEDQQRAPCFCWGCFGFRCRMCRLMACFTHFGFALHSDAVAEACQPVSCERSPGAGITGHVNQYCAVIDDPGLTAAMAVMYSHPGSMACL